MSLDPVAYLEGLKAEGVTLFSGVPCSILAPLLAAIQADGDVRSLPAVSEGAAAALAAGYYLGSRRLAGVYLQNSGLGSITDPLASLLIPYRIPTLFLISYRGEPGDAAHHQKVGEWTPGLTRILFQGLCFPVSAPYLSSHVALAREKRLPVAQLVSRGRFMGGEQASPLFAHREPTIGFMDSSGGEPLLTRRQAIERVLSAVSRAAPGAVVFATAGLTSRELFVLGDRVENFYAQGSMGHVAALALGFSLAQPDRPIVVLDGDGSLLMGLGVLAMVGRVQPRRFLHVVLDNGIYASTGGQATLSPVVDFPEVAAACGYKQALDAARADGCLFDVALATETGPTLIRVPLIPGEMEGVDRPTLRPDEITDRFMGAVCAQ